MTLDRYRIRIDDRIRLIEYQALVDFDNAGMALPDGAPVRRRSNGSIAEVVSGYANEGDLRTSRFDLDLRVAFDFAGGGRLGSWLAGGQGAGLRGDPRRHP